MSAAAFLVLGLVSTAWAAFSLITGKGHYKGCPPGGYDRAEHPFHFWAPTILGIGVCMILLFLGWIPLPSRAYHP